MIEENNSWERQTINKMLEMTLKEQRASRRWGIFFKLLFVGYLVTITFLIVAPKKSLVHGLKSKAHTAMISIDGEISANKDTSAQEIIPLLRDAFEDNYAKAVMLRINSPGGSPVQTQQIYTEMLRLRAKYPEKKIYAVIEDVGASGAYWLACGADEIYADRTSIVGSIGVVMSSFGFVDTMKKLGVERRLYTAGDNKGMLDPFSPRNPKQDAMLQTDINQAHQLFIDVVKDARGKRLKISNDMFSGRFWLGMDAQRLGLIDGFGDPFTVSRDIIKAPEIVEYSVPQTLFGQLGNHLGQNFQGFIDNVKLS